MREGVEKVSSKKKGPEVFGCCFRRAIGPQKTLEEGKDWKYRCLAGPCRCFLVLAHAAGPVPCAVPHGLGRVGETVFPSGPKEWGSKPTLAHHQNAALFSFLRSLIERAKKSYPASLTLVTAPQFWKIDLIVNSSTLVSTFPT